MSGTKVYVTKKSQSPGFSCHFRWSLWYLKADKTKDWKDNLKLVISFDTVSQKLELWCVCVSACLCVCLCACKSQREREREREREGENVVFLCFTLTTAFTFMSTSSWFLVKVEDFWG